MAGHMTLDHGIGVRIPASQPLLRQILIRHSHKEQIDHILRLWYKRLRLISVQLLQIKWERRQKDERAQDCFLR